MFRLIEDNNNEVWLSFGCGVQTCYMLFKFPERYKKGGLIFADTGDETPETYDYLEKYVLPFCKKHNIRFETVNNPKWQSLLDHCFKRQIIPSMLQRWCTKEHKVQPIQRFYRKVLKADRKRPIQQDIGFSFDEYVRAENQSKYSVLYIKNHYPLVDLKITRQECEKGFSELGFPTPPKSGCWFCPFYKKEYYRQMKINDPERFEKVCKLEEQNRRFPKKLLKFTKPLRKVDFNSYLDDFMDSCETGYCMK
jgi:3'-phosphoadenosine 5'-phosphosulfate sulfotransferase (PAPS reductase)/FAD synthetase